MRHLLAVLLLAFFAPLAAAQRVNLDTGWIPSAEYTNTPADYSADAFAITSCSDAACTVSVVAPRLQYRYRVTVRNLTNEWHTSSGMWLTYFWLLNAPNQSAGNAMAAQGVGVPEMYAFLAPNDGLPGGPDEATFDVTRTFTVGSDGITVWTLPASLFAPNARGGSAHRLVVRPTHWWSITCDGQAMPVGGHWPLHVTIESAEARLSALVSHL